MAAIRAKNTKPEVIVRRLLHMMGHRFRLHVAALPGRPDIVIPRIDTIIQIKGCFWHGHHCLKGRVPLGNRPYWKAKIEGNKRRDLRNERRLRAMGWRVRTVWECRVRASSPLQLYERLEAATTARSGQRGVKKTLLDLSRLSNLQDALSSVRNRKKSPS